jgi:hypothetical protein
MADAIFTKETLLKSQLYTRIKTLLTGAGWQNVSSKPVTDFDVFTSAGETGDKQLVMQLSEVYTGNALGSTTNHYLMVRLPYSYIPGAAGVAGTFGRPSDAWLPVSCFDTNISPDTQFDFYYHVNKNRIIFVIEPPKASGFGPQAVYLGMSNETMINEIKSDGCMVACTKGMSNSSVWMTSKPKEKTTAPYYLLCYPLVTPKEDSPDNTRIISKMFYGDTYEGVRGIIDSVYYVHNTTDGVEHLQTAHGDVLITKDASAKYRVFICKTAASSTWNYKGASGPGYRGAIAIRIE